MAQLQKVGKTATSIYTANGYTSVRYHATEVVKFDYDKIILNSGGWRTNTTKTRMNQASNQFDLGFAVYQKDFSWYVSYAGKDHEFYDGIILERS